MSDRPSNPYQTPKAKPMPSVPSKPLCPPITLVRLMVGLVLITIAWSGIWAKVREAQLIGYWAWILGGIGVGWVVDPSARKRKIPFKPRDTLWVMVAVAGLIALLVLAKETWPHRWLSEVIVLPISLVSGWLLSCAGLVIAWWKRRNNPPLQG